jgi:ACR3 family arsenite transporter
MLARHVEQAPHHRPLAQVLSDHLGRYLLAYAVAAIAVGWLVGIAFPTWIQGHRSILETTTTVLVFFMIYPMMVNLSLEMLPRVVRAPRPILLSVGYNFLLTPALTYAFVRLLVSQPQLGLGLYLVMLIPGSSMSLGYTGLVGGSVEVGSLAMALNFLLVPVVLPAYLHLMVHGTVPVPLEPLLKALLLVLVLPMGLGLLTRLAILRRAGPVGLARVKPYLGLVTMVLMLWVIATIFGEEGKMLEQHGALLIPLFAATVGYLVVILALATWLNRQLGLSYADHMGIAFLASGKNNGTAIAITTLAFGPMVAIPAATLPLFQSILLIGYVQMAPVIRRYFHAK